MKTVKAIMVTVLIAIAPQAFAQDGEGLFKAKCSTCHSLKQNSTGPMLQGAKAKWEDAGESDLLYEWVRNAPQLIAAGNSSMANAVKNFSPSNMTPQQVTNEEVDAILTYVDGWTPPPPPVNGTPTENGEVVYVANYAWNLNMFYILCTLTIVLLIAIIVMSGTVTRMIKSDFFQKKLRERNNTLNTLLLVGLFIGMSATSYALEFNAPGEAEEGEPWLLIENMDLYVMLTINVILVGVLLYVRRMFNTFLEMTKAPKTEAEVAEEEDVMKKVNQILTDVVPIEEEHTILMDHEYDGIRELDNNLPPWWVWGFYCSIAFAVVYLFHYHILGTGDLQEVAYKKEMKRENAKVEAYLKQMAMNVTAEDATIMTEASDINAGKTLFIQNCVLCHNPDGEGIEGSGPNLTDKYWIYGYEMKDVFTTIGKGRPGGMPEHKSKFTPIQIQQVASYVLQLPQKDGVAPNGEIIEKEGTQKNDE